MTIKPMGVWIGFDPREAAAFMVARESVRQFHRNIPVSAVRLRHLWGTDFTASDVAPAGASVPGYYLERGPAPKRPRPCGRGP